MLASYNVRGLNKKPKQAYVRQLISDNSVSLVGLLETRVKEHKASRICRNICKNWTWAFNYDHHCNGRIWVGWNPSIWNVAILFVSSQLIHCKINQLNSTNQPFLVSFVYGLNSYIKRRDLWRDLVSLSPSDCWCLLGDFNVISTLNETSNEEVTWDIGMDEFKECTQNIGVGDIRGIGPLFTWWNCQVARPIHKKLDRALGNSCWFSSFPQALVTFAPRGLSDHSPVILNTGVTSVQSRKYFQFFNHLLLLEGFTDCVQTAWSSPVHGNPFFVFKEKLKRTKRALISLNQSHGNLSSAVKLAKANLHQTQLLLQSSPLDPMLLEQEDICSKTLWTAMEREESLIQQKSRTTWLSLGDKNTSFFSNMLKSRWNSNKILSIQNSEGDLVHGQEAIEFVAVDYFKSIFNDPPNTSYGRFEDFCSFAPRTIN